MSEPTPHASPRASSRSSLDGPEALLLSAWSATNTHPTEFRDYTSLEYSRSEASWLSATLPRSPADAESHRSSFWAFLRRRGRDRERRRTAGPGPDGEKAASTTSSLGAAESPARAGMSGNVSVDSEQQTVATPSYGTRALSRLLEAPGPL